MCHQGCGRGNRSTLPPMAVSDSYLHEFSEPLGYLDFAAIGPPSRRVRGAVADAYAKVSEPDGDVGPPILGAYEAALGTAGRFLGVAPELVTVVPSTSAGLFAVAFGLAPFGGNIVVPAHEFPANIYPWLRAAGMGGPEIRVVEIPDRRARRAGHPGYQPLRGIGRRGRGARHPRRQLPARLRGGLEVAPGGPVDERRSGRRRERAGRWATSRRPAAHEEIGCGGGSGGRRRCHGVACS